MGVSAVDATLRVPLGGRNLAMDKLSVVEGHLLKAVLLIPQAG
jgi:hypothetical protein